MNSDRESLAQLVEPVRRLLAEADTIDGEIAQLLDGAPVGKVRGIVSKAVALRETRDSLRSLAMTRLELAEAAAAGSFPGRGTDAAGWLRNVEARIAYLDESTRRAAEHAAAVEAEHQAEEAARVDAEAQAAERQRQAEARRERDRQAEAEAEERRRRVRLEIDKLAEQTRKRIAL